MNLVLIGYRGTGKSVVAKLLAERTGRPVVSLDEEIVRRIGCSIPAYVAKFGWEAFRDVEQEVAAEVSGRDGLIVDAGGGVVTRRANVDALRDRGRIIWLSADPATIAARIQDDRNRPSLTGDKSFLDEVEEVLAARTPLYADAAHFQVDTTGRTPLEVAECILRLVPDL